MILLMVLLILFLKVFLVLIFYFIQTVRKNNYEESRKRDWDEKRKRSQETYDEWKVQWDEKWKKEEEDGYQLIEAQKIALQNDSDFKTILTKMGWDEEKIRNNTIINIYEKEISKSKNKLIPKSNENLLERAKVTPRVRLDVLHRDNYTCQICGTSPKSGAVLHVDHIFPISKGGKSVMENLQTLCSECNLGKGSKIY